jgi:hypothetical protein
MTLKELRDQLDHYLDAFPHHKNREIKLKTSDTSVLAEVGLRKVELNTGISAPVYLLTERRVVNAPYQWV